MNTYKLTQTQRTVIYALKLIPFKQYANIGTEVVFESEIDMHFMMQALVLASLRAPNNRIRLLKKDDDIVQYFSDEALDKIDYIEFDNDKTYKKDLFDYNAIPLVDKEFKGQLFKIRLVKKPNGELAINGCFSHIIYDAYSILMFYQYIFETYKALIHNEPLPPELDSPVEAFEIDYSYEGSNKQQIDRKYYDEIVFNTEPQFTTILGRNSKTFNKNRRSGKMGVSLTMKGGSLDLPIDNNTVDLVKKYAEEKRVSTQSLYLLAYRTYLSKVCEVDDVAIQSVINRRPTTIQKRAGSTMADTVWNRTIFSNDISFNEGLQRIFKEEMEGYKHANFGAQNALGLVYKKYNTKKMETYASFQLTYQPGFYIDDEIKYRMNKISNGKEVMLLYASIMPHNTNKDYIVNYTYQKDFVKESNINELHNFVLNFLNEGINNDSKTINEIIKAIE